MVNLVSLSALTIVIGALQEPTTTPHQLSSVPLIGYDIHRDQEWQRSVAFYNDGWQGPDSSADSYNWSVEVSRRDEKTVLRFSMRECAGLAGKLAQVAQADSGQFSLPGIIVGNGNIARRIHGHEYRLWGSTRDEQGFAGKIAIWPTGEMAAALSDLDARVRECADKR